MLSEPLPNKGVPDKKSESLLKSRTQSGHIKGSVKHKKFAKKQKEDLAKVKSAYHDFEQAGFVLGKQDALLNKYIFRETVTQVKYDKALTEYKKLVAYFTWHAVNGISLIRKDARTYRDIAKDSLRELKLVRIVG